MSDPTKVEPKYDTGETAQEATDRMAGNGGRVHPSAAAPTEGPTKKVGPDTHPSAPHTYGSPLGQTILRDRDGT